MLQNLKVDIIYYKTNTDFEMEFNLCGCCRMRLLTDKAADKKMLVHDLARAVSRSRVIIIAGKLSGEEGIIDITAKSIAKTVTEVDKGKYGIKSEESVGVINGATPLVTPDGEFGGCVIESGPQSMILLPDDRELRKTVMKTLIHPYIEELCTMEIKAKAKNTEPEIATVIAPPEPQAYEMPEEKDKTDADINEAESCIEENLQKEETADVEVTEKAQDDTAEPESETETEVTENKPLSDFSSKPYGVTLEGGMSFETDDYRATAESVEGGENSELLIEPESFKKNRLGRYNHSFESEQNDDSPDTTPDRSEEKHKSVFSGNIPILIISVLLLVVLAVLCYCIFYVPAKDGVSASAYISETFNTLFGK